jgi:glycosyltransferase involved in cell wall biosynthesis
MHGGSAPKNANVVSPGFLSANGGFDVTEETCLSAIDFLHRGVAFSGETMRNASIGGIESSLVQLAEALARRGHDVTVFNGVRESRREYGVNWRPLEEASQFTRGDIGIAVASPKAFKGTSFRSHIFWLHNPVKSSRIIRRGEVWPLLRTRPLIVVLGPYHASRMPRWLPSQGTAIIYHGIHEDFFRPEPAFEAPPPRAIFTSQPYRGLDWLLDLWLEVKRQVPAATFHVFAPKNQQAAANAARCALDGISFGGSIARPALAREMRGVRVHLIPGHRDETYCLAAGEAIASGVPVVTLGIGSLSERVKDGQTGFVARNKDEFVARTAALLSDDKLWRAMHQACLADASLTSWDERAAEWESLFARLKLSTANGALNCSS